MQNISRTYEFETWNAQKKDPEDANADHQDMIVKAEKFNFMGSKNKLFCYLQN